MNQQTIEGLTVPGQHGPRPTVTDEMKLAAAMPIAKQILTGVNDDVEEGAKDIADNGSIHCDGYELAKALERDGWDIRRDDIDTLDMYSTNLNRELAAAEKTWADVNEIQPPLPIHSRITARNGEEGEITGIYEHGAASYLVRMDSNTDSDDASNRRRIIKFEEAIAS